MSAEPLSLWNICLYTVEITEQIPVTCAPWIPKLELWSVGFVNTVQSLSVSQFSKLTQAPGAWYLMEALIRQIILLQTPSG